MSTGIPVSVCLGLFSRTEYRTYDSHCNGVAVSTVITVYSILAFYLCAGDAPTERERERESGKGASIPQERRMVQCDQQRHSGNHRVAAQRLKSAGASRDVNGGADPFR